MYNNLENGGSQCGFCIFLQDFYRHLSLTMWQSKKIQKLALVDAVEASR